jgi:uncharacterized protein (TIRG00374 family)
MDKDHNASQRPSPFQSLGSTPRRRIVIILLLLAGTYLLLPRLAGAADALQMMRQGDGRYLLAASALQIVAILAAPYLVYQAAPAFGPALRFWDVLQVALASQFTTLFIPSAGLSGVALRVRYFGERNCPLETTLLTYALETLGFSIGIAIAVALALVSLTVSGHGAPWWILGLLLGTILLGVAILSTLLANAREGDWRHAVLEWVNRVLVKLGHLPLSMATIQQRLGQLRQAINALNTPLRLRLVLTGLARAAADILCLQMTLLAFGQVVPLHWTTIGYGLSNVLAYLSSLPGGLVVTEASLLAILAKQGVPVAMAVAATLTYRLFAFWMPRTLGVVSLWNLQRQSDRPVW